MRKRLLMILMSSLIALGGGMLQITNIYADENDVVDDTAEDSSDVENEGDLTPDYDTNGFEAWLPDYNPKLREFYGGYNRGGNFVILYNDGRVSNASSIKVSWTSSGTVQDFKVGGSYVRRNDNQMKIREYANTTGTITIKRACSEHKAPAYGSAFRTGATLPSGTYTVTKQALEFVEVVKPNGNKVWVAPQYGDDGNKFYSQNYAIMNDSKATLSVNIVNGVPIKQKWMPIREDKRTGISMQPKYVTIHNTASPGNGATAAAHANLQINDGRTWVSWQYTVDNKEIYQSIPMNEVAYHAGDGIFLGNSSTVGIEICENADGNYAKAEQNAAYLTAQILYENGLPSDAVRMHKDWSGKNCAHNIIEGTKGSMGWTAFKNLVKKEYDRLAAENSLSTTVPEIFKPLMENSGYQFNNGYVSKLTIDSTIQAMVDKFKATDNTISVTAKKGGSAIALNNKVATGQTVTITKGDSTFTFMNVIRADTNGDGKISSLDYAYVKNDILKISSLTRAYRLAADVSKDGRVSSLDYAHIKNHILNIKKIEQ